MHELAELQELVGRGGYYAALRFSTDTADPANGALLQWVQEQETAIQTTLLFFELEWAALSDEQAEALLAGEGLDFCAHHLRNVRRYREHLLTEPEERILTEKSLTGAGAWTRLFEELTSVIEVELPAETTAREPRHALAEGGAGGRPQPPLDGRPRGAPQHRRGRHRGARARACVPAPTFSTRCSPTRRPTIACAAIRTGWPRATSPTRPATSRCRRWSRPYASRYEIPRRWYRLKARLLGVERLADYDRMASVTEDEVVFPYSQAREIVLDCYGSLLSRAGRASPSASSTSAGSTRRYDRPSAAAPSAPERSPRSSPTCCSTTPPSAATC